MRTRSEQDQYVLDRLADVVLLALSQGRQYAIIALDDDAIPFCVTYIGKARLQ